jgi:hypothetical protein
MAYTGFVTVMIDRETLTGMADMDDETRAKLAVAAKAYLDAPANLRAAIIEAGRNGDKPADIARAIDYAFTYDYVARLIRQDRGPSKPATTTGLKRAKRDE